MSIESGGFFGSDSAAVGSEEHMSSCKTSYLVCDKCRAKHDCEPECHRLSQYCFKCLSCGKVNRRYNTLP